MPENFKDCWVLHQPLWFFKWSWRLKFGLMSPLASSWLGKKQDCQQASSTVHSLLPNELSESRYGSAKEASAPQWGTGAPTSWDVTQSSCGWAPDASGSHSRCGCPCRNQEGRLARLISGVSCEQHREEIIIKILKCMRNSFKCLHLGNDFHAHSGVTVCISLGFSIEVTRGSESSVPILLLWRPLMATSTTRSQSVWGTEFKNRLKNLQRLFKAQASSWEMELVYTPRNFKGSG